MNKNTVLLALLVLCSNVSIAQTVLDPDECKQFVLVNNGPTGSADFFEELLSMSSGVSPVQTDASFAVLLTEKQEADIKAYVADYDAKMWRKGLSYRRQCALRAHPISYVTRISNDSPAPMLDLTENETYYLEGSGDVESSGDRAILVALHSFIEQMNQLNPPTPQLLLRYHEGWHRMQAKLRSQRTLLKYHDEWHRNQSQG